MVENIGEPKMQVWVPDVRFRLPIAHSIRHDGAVRILQTDWKKTENSKRYPQETAKVMISRDSHAMVEISGGPKMQVWVPVNRFRRSRCRSIRLDGAVRLLLRKRKSDENSQSYSRKTVQHHVSRDNTACNGIGSHPKI
jgi:hypothetical protein